MNSGFTSKLILFVVIALNVVVLGVIGYLGWIMFAQDTFVAGYVDPQIDLPDDVLISSLVYQEVDGSSDAFDFSVSDDVNLHEYSSCWSYLDPATHEGELKKTDSPMIFWGSGTGISGESAVVRLYCDRNLKEVNEVVISGTALSDILFLGAEDSLNMDRGTALSEFRVDDSLQVYTKRIYKYDEDYKIIVGDVPLYFTDETVEEGYLELRLPFSILTDKQYFPDLEYTNESWGSADYFFGMICATPGCTEAKFSAPE